MVMRNEGQEASWFIGLDWMCDLQLGYSANLMNDLLENTWFIHSTSYQPTIFSFIVSCLFTLTLIALTDALLINYPYFELLSLLYLLQSKQQPSHELICSISFLCNKASLNSQTDESLFFVSTDKSKCHSVSVMPKSNSWCWKSGWCIEEWRKVLLSLLSCNRFV
jgi:hypothetical protein